MELHAHAHACCALHISHPAFPAGHMWLLLASRPHSFRELVLDMWSRAVLLMKDFLRCVHILDNITSRKQEHLELRSRYCLDLLLPAGAKE